MEKINSILHVPRFLFDLGTWYYSGTWYVVRSSGTCGWEMDRDFASAGNKTRTSTGTKTKTWSVIFALHKQLGTEINIIQFLPFTLLIEELINNLIFCSILIGLEIQRLRGKLV